MQFAAAAHACSMSTQAQTRPVGMAAMPDCDGQMAGSMDPNQPQLCKVHCEQGTQTVDSAPAFDAQSPPVLVAILDWTRGAVPELRRIHPQHRIPPGAPPPGSPPLYLCLLVLRN